MTLKYGDFIKSIEVGNDFCYHDVTSNICVACDGVGTKLMIAELFNNYSSIGIDLVAMCVNDLLCGGASPFLFLDYYACHELDPVISKQIIGSIKLGCELAGCTLVGGETAVLNNMYPKGLVDLAGFAVGTKYWNFKYNGEPGVLMGIPSTGIHANGYTELRDNIKITPEMRWLLLPTRIYCSEIRRLYPYIYGAAHITGGGLIENVPRMGITRNIDYSFNFGSFWKGIQNYVGFDTEKMMSTFNCGYGMVVLVPHNQVAMAQAVVPELVIIGEVN